MNPEPTIDPNEVSIRTMLALEKSAEQTDRLANAAEARNLLLAEQNNTLDNIFNAMNGA